MINQMANVASEKLVENEIITKDKQEIYLYGFQLMFATIFKGLGIIIVAMLLGLLKETAIFFLAFGFLRVNSGGYHSGGYLKCFIVSLVAFTASVMASQLLVPYFTLPIVIGILAIVNIIIFKRAPIESENKPLSDEQKKKFKLKSRVIVVTESLMVLSIWSFYGNLKTYGALIIMAIVLVSASTFSFKLSNEKIK